MKDIEFVMNSINCPNCSCKNWMWFRGKEEFNKALCMECCYPLSNECSFVDKISWQYRKYFKNGNRTAKKV